MHASTWTRLAIGGKLTRIVPVTSTASKNAVSVSSTTSRLSHSVPVFCAANFTWIGLPGQPRLRPDRGRRAIDFWIAAPFDASVTVLNGAQNADGGSGCRT